MEEQAYFGKSLGLDYPGVAINNGINNESKILLGLRKYNKSSI